MRNENILEMHDVSVEYRTDEAVVYAVDHLSLSLQAGETLGLVGETGAGKTTAALSVMKLLPDKVGYITSGNIIVDGTDITKATDADMQLIRGNTVSMIFQDPMSSLNPVIPVGRQILEVLQLHNEENKTKKELESEVDRMLDMVGIPSSRKHEYPHQFSGGMKQRVVIAIALACQPKLLLADEPTTALDVTIQAQVLALIADLKVKLNTAMLLITHDLGVVAQTCDKVAVMYAGQIVEYGSAEDIFEADAHHPYTTGLFGALPDMALESRRLHPIDGLMPDPTVRMPGCRFSPRCPNCTEQCRGREPKPVHVSPGHTIVCHLYSGDEEASES